MQESVTIIETHVIARDDGWQPKEQKFVSLISYIKSAVLNGRTKHVVCDVDNLTP